MSSPTLPSQKKTVKEGQIVSSDVTLAFQLEPGVDQTERLEGRHLTVSQGGALHSEDQAVPSPLRLCGGPTIRSQMERGKDDAVNNSLISFSRVFLRFVSA